MEMRTCYYSHAAVDTCPKLVPIKQANDNQASPLRLIQNVFQAPMLKRRIYQGNVMILLDGVDVAYDLLFIECCCSVWCHDLEFIVSKNLSRI